MDVSIELFRRYYCKGFERNGENFTSFHFSSDMIKLREDLGLFGIGLKDRFGLPIINGCTVELLTSINRFPKGMLFRCVWNIPNHRYGFSGRASIEINSKPSTFANPSMESSEAFYATPANAKNLKVIL